MSSDRLGDAAAGAAAERYRQVDEDELLTALKREAAVRSSSYKEDTGGQDAPRNSPPALAAAAFGKYASAVSTTRHQKATVVMANVPPLDAHDAAYGEEQMSERLHREADEARAAEEGGSAGRVARRGYAAKLQSACDKFDKMLALEKQPGPGAGAAGGTATATAAHAGDSEGAAHRAEAEVQSASPSSSLAGHAAAGSGGRA